MAHDLDTRTKMKVAMAFALYKVRELYQWYSSVYVTVSTRVGQVRGVHVSSQIGRIKYAQFTGIPYAQPPVGPLRFCDPQPLESSASATCFDATAESKACQRDVFTARYCGDEDCLHLNIYTKQLQNDKVRARRPASSAGAPPSPVVMVPVMVFFHGGAFMFGCNNKDLYNPEFLLRKDIVLVTVNYRLGALGFLSVTDPSAAAPGNAGLKDQVMALRWIREHIADFGGDPHNVTIFGESAGGCSVHYHLVSPMSRGLFHRAIAMSGAALTSWSICPLQHLPERLARSVGWDGDGGTEQMMRVLRAAKADRLLRAQEKLADGVEKRQYMMFTFGPKVEPYVAEQCFIGEDPVRMCRAPWSGNVPVIFSACSNEGLLVRKATQRSKRLIENLEERFQDMVPLDLMGGVQGDRDGAVAKEVARAFRSFYFADAQMTLAQLVPFEHMMCDKLFLHGIYRAIQMRLAAGGEANTWYLRFDMDSKVLNLTKYMFAGHDARGSCHADDCHYLFRTCIHPALAEGTAEFEAIDRFVSLWTEFARTGNPNGELTRPLVEWNAVQSNGPMECLNFSNDLVNIEMPELERMRFWDTLYQKQEEAQMSERDANIPAASL